MTPDERSTEDIITDLMADKIRQLEADVAAERRAKLEILGRYDSVLLDKHALETRVALLEAETKKARSQERRSDHYSNGETRQVLERLVVDVAEAAASACDKYPAVAVRVDREAMRLMAGLGDATKSIGLPGRGRLRWLELAPREDAADSPFVGLGK